MLSIGHKIEVPPQSNTKAWSLLYDFLTKPYSGFSRDLDPERHQENLHYENCKVRKEYEGKACATCKTIEKRMPDFGKVSALWNQNVY